MTCYDSRENDLLRAWLELQAQDPDTPGYRKAERKYLAALDLLERYH